MITLPQEYKVKGQRGFIYRQVNRIGDIVISEQVDVELDKVVGFEVFIVQKYQDRQSPDGKTFIPAKEAPPSTESWGTKGWTYNVKQEADKKFASLVI